MKKEFLKNTPEKLQEKDLKTEKKENIKQKKKKKKAFTLIELLAVIIILGVLMIIAVPSVTKYISDSRKSSYITTARNVIDGARILIHSGKFNLNDRDTTYYIPASFIKTDNSLRTPYGDITQAYVGIVYNEDNYDYYWISNDTTGQGVKEITSEKKLDNSLIVEDINDTDIRNKVETTGIKGRSKILILNNNGTWENTRYAIEDTTGENNEYYLYYNDEYSIDRGLTVLKDGSEYVYSGVVTGHERTYRSTHTFDNYQAALADRTYWKNPSKPYNFFIRLKITDNIITGMDLGYYLNNNLYYLKAFDKKYYQSNKEKTINAFGIDKCETNEYCSYTNDNVLIGCDEAISCLIPSTDSDPGLYISINEEGTLDAFDGNLGNSGWSCNIGVSWSWCVVPW